MDIRFTAAMSNAHDTYVSPLASRNSSPEMLKLFSSSNKFGLWRRLWLELARCERDLGIDRITPDALKQMESKLDDIDFNAAAAWEKRLRHDVMAHVHTFEEAAPAARGIIHLGATSQFVVDNADLIIMRQAMKLTARRLASVIDALGTFAEKWKDLPTLGYTHFQPAQPTTVGKRATLWAQDFLIDLGRDRTPPPNAAVSRRQRNHRHTGFLPDAFQRRWFQKCDQLDERITQKFGFAKSFAVTGSNLS